MAWWRCQGCAVYWEENTQAEYSVCWCCGGATGTEVTRLHVRQDTQHIMSFPDTTVTTMDPALD